MLGGCATSYQENDPFWGGVSATPMGADTYRVASELNAFSGAQTVHDYLMLRAAETAQAQGAVGFQIFELRDASVRVNLTSGGTSVTTAQVTGTRNTVSGAAVTTSTGPSTQEIIRPGGVMMIKLVREPVIPGLDFVRARDIIETVGRRVKGRR